VTLPELPRSAVPEPGAYEAAAQWIREMRELQLRRRPDEGLREHKKRLTRQQISDTATWMSTLKRGCSRRMGYFLVIRPQPFRRWSSGAKAA